jgi:tRNA U34 5-methylaminomethyl-2-thiouridine-forming methyltransferase MnmC
MKPQFITTSDGSHTLYLSDMDEQYHSVKGALTESNYVYLDKGFLFHKSETPKVFEVGFGTGLNCLITALKAQEQKRPTTYYTIEKYPLDKETIDQLNYGKIISKEAEILFKKIHDCNWNETVDVSKYFKLIKLNGDLLNTDLNNLESCDIIYFDAFGPDKQPEMWSPEILQRIYKLTAPDGIFVTYSAKGAIRRQLASCGYEMKRLPGPPGKFHMLHGTKNI